MGPWVPLTIGWVGHPLVADWSKSQRGTRSGIVGAMAHQMNGDELDRFLSTGTRTGKLATVRADGSPHVAPVWFILDHDDLVFMTGAKTVKGRAILRVRVWPSQWTTSIRPSHSRSSKAPSQSPVTRTKCSRCPLLSPGGTWARNWPNSTADEMPSTESCFCDCTASRLPPWLILPTRTPLAWPVTQNTGSGAFIACGIPALCGRPTAGPFPGSSPDWSTAEPSKRAVTVRLHALINALGAVLASRAGSPVFDTLIIGVTEGRTNMGVRVEAGSTCLGLCRKVGRHEKNLDAHCRSCLWPRLLRRHGVSDSCSFEASALYRNR